MVGIEVSSHATKLDAWLTYTQAHICILQTALSLLSLPARIIPYVVADAVSSTNPLEVPIAFDRLRQEGALVTTSESLAYQLIGDASQPAFKPFTQFMKQDKPNALAALKVLLGPKEETGSVPKSAM